MREAVEQRVALLKVADAADRLNVAPSWVYGRIHEGTLPFPHIKIGHYVRIPEADLHEYLSAALAASRNGASK